MYQSKQHLEVVKASFLKDKLKSLAPDLDDNDAIRLHRAISWVKCAEEQAANPDLKFITLWIAFNACYAYSDAHELVLSEKKRFRDFICKLVSFDAEDRFFKLLWYKFSGPVRLLIDNKYAYKQFWDAQRGQSLDWEALFKQSKIDSRNYLAHQQVSNLLELVLDRLYTVRNQLIHGGATYQSKLNRSQVKDASQILEFLLPIIIDIMINNGGEDWGVINYPVIE
ncbi:HEPN domain-containing protein [Gelidibacter sp. F2691]|nr:HEPN domain-containing protein [Gelidibacter sp. F2691]